jgi:hypothetical protein
MPPTIPPGRYLGGAPKPARTPAAGVPSQDLVLLVDAAQKFLSLWSNMLHVLTQQAEQGNPQARQTLSLLHGNLERSRAAAAGIITPNGS